MQDLKPCAHCNCTYIDEWHDKVSGLPHYLLGFLYCVRCGIRTKAIMHNELNTNEYDKCIKELKEMWNTRC